MSVGGLGPAEVLEHHHAGQQHRARVDLVEAGVLGGGAVGGLEDAVAGDVVDVPPGAMPIPPTWAARASER